MNEKEALKIREIYNKGREIVVEQGGDEKEASHLDELLAEAVMKQTPTRPLLSDSKLYFLCPNPKCNRFVDRHEPAHGNIDIRNCKWCGQAFDWSEYKDTKTPQFYG